jgi:hypothetical protein
MKNGRRHLARVFKHTRASRRTLLLHEHPSHNAAIFDLETTLLPH